MKPTQHSAPETMQTPDATAVAGSTLQCHGTTLALPTQDLSGDVLLVDAPRVRYLDLNAPSLGGIPILCKLGEGGMGAVYVGMHPRLNQPVAVKVLPTERLNRNRDMLLRFYREAQLAARIHSEHVAGVMDVNEENGLFYIVMEYVAGINAKEYVKRGGPTVVAGITEKDALAIAIAASKGLAVAHANGILHRDIKPENILIPCEAATSTPQLDKSKLADLGLAREDSDENIAVTRPGMFIGTPGYMSPEQIEDPRACVKASDVFSVGATLYALLAGTPPFIGSLRTVLSDTLTKPHLSLENRAPNISTPTAKLVDICLNKDPLQRFVDGKTLLTALHVCQEALASPGRSVDAVRRVSALQKLGESGAGGNIVTAKKGSMRAWLMSACVAMILIAGYSIWRKQDAQAQDRLTQNALNIANDARRERDQSIPVAKPVETTSTTVKPIEPSVEKPTVEKPIKPIVERTVPPTVEEKTAPQLPAAELTLKLGGGIDLEFVLVESGTFRMGSEEQDTFVNSRPAHNVKINNSFYIAKYPVTVAQFSAFCELANYKYKTDAERDGKAFVLINKSWVEKKGVSWRDPEFPGFKQGDDHPVVLVSWNDARAFCNWASEQTKRTLRLPSEAEWEYAARGKESLIYPWGNLFDGKKCNHADATLKASAACSDDLVYSDVTDGYAFTSPVNAFDNLNPSKVKDMAGNVWQWCEDTYDKDIYNHADGNGTINRADGDTKVLRGGSWYDDAIHCRSSFRNSLSADGQNPRVGFRVFLEIEK